MYYSLIIDKNLPKNNLEDLKFDAEHNDPEAMFLLGMAYHQGINVPQDITCALHWLDKAAAKNNEKAAYNLALIYFLGDGVVRDLVRGRNYLHLAVKCGRSDLEPVLQRIDERYRPRRYRDMDFDMRLLENNVVGNPVQGLKAFFTSRRGIKIVILFVPLGLAMASLNAEMPIAFVLLMRLFALIFIIFWWQWGR